MNKRIKAISPSLTLGIEAKAAALRAEGKIVYSFAAGEPDFDTPQQIKAAAEAALEDGATKYAPVAGVPALKTAIAAKLKKDNGLDYSPQQIQVNNGAKHSLFNIFMTICDEGDEVIIPEPYWLSYPEMVNVAGAKPVYVKADDHTLKVSVADVEAAVTERTVAIIINSPSNPTGVVYNREEIRALAEVAVKNDFYIVSDEIYEKIIYNGDIHVSAGSLSDEIFQRTITVNGFSKTYSMTGWRLGYFAGPLDVVKAATAFQSHSTSAPNTFAQYGAIEALKSGDHAADFMIKEFSGRRDTLYSRLSRMKGVSCVKPTGAFYMFPDISSFGMDSVTFSEKLLEEASVAVVPGAPFGADRNIRLSYACSMDNICAGMDRMADWIKSKF